MLAFELAAQAFVIVLMVWVGIRQILIPVLRGTRLFPALSKQHLEIVDQITEVDQEIAAEKLRHVLAAKQAELAKEKTHE